MNPTEQETADWYKNYYLREGKDRNDLFANPEVVFQHLANEEAVLRALRSATTINRETARILDVGCGSGGSLARFIALGFRPANLHGIDLLQDRIDEGHHRYPNLNCVCDDATSMRFESGTFDLVLESTMFVQITDEDLSQRIAHEMLRVTRPKGYLLLVDWRYGKPRNPSYLAVSKQRIGRMFRVGETSNIVSRSSGALVPPVGRFVSKYVPSTYFLLRTLLPFLVGVKATLLQKRDS